MKKIAKYIPNTITSLNILCGTLAIIFIFENNMTMVFWLVIAAAIFDFLDGFAARLLKAYSAIGADLDSLCDMVSFGVVPSLVVYKLFPSDFVFPWIALSIAAFSALRLAKFNNDTRQSENFRGLATPAAALMVVSLGAVTQHPNSYNIDLASWITNPWFLSVLSVLLSALLVCDIEMFSLKFKEYSIRNNSMRYLFLLLCVVIIIMGDYLAPAMIVLTYILLSVGSAISNKLLKRRQNKL